MLLRLLILAALIFFLFRAVRSLFVPKRPQQRKSQTGPHEEGAISDMVQDPHCGVYVSKSEAFPVRTRNGMLYFCSEECCKKYLEKQ